MSRKTTRRRAPAVSRQPTLRRVMWWLLAALVLAASLAFFWLWRGDRAAFPTFVRTADQNVLLITIDTLRGDALGSYGGRAATPNLDRLALDGVRFTFAHAHAVMTLPSHASILTGRYPFGHGVRDNAGFRLGDSALTLAELAKAKGFATGAFVGAFPLDRQFGLAQGFDVYDDVGGREVAQADFKFTERRAGEVVSAARAWIEQQQKPWLAWVHVFDPHAPYAPPSPFDGDYASDPYAGEVAYVDRALGPLLDLAGRGSRPTAVIVTSDHGEALGDHGEQTHGIFAYESTLRVPLIVAQVGSGLTVGSNGATSSVPVRHIDVLPTVAALLAVDVPPGLPGSPLPLARDADAQPRASYFEAMTPLITRGWAPLWGVIVDREKYIDLPIEEFYDLEADPIETKNLAGTERDRLQRLTARLNAFEATLPGEPAAENAAARARLRSLGYVSGAAPRKTQYGQEDDPKNLIDLEIMMSRGIELHQSGRYKEAVDTYHQILDRRPAMSLAYRRLATIHWEHGAAAEAISTLRRTIERNGPDIETEIRLATFLAETGASERAIELLERLLAADPDTTEGLNALGIAYARAGRNAEALLMLERVLAINPRDAFALENIGTVHLQREDFAAAEQAFARAVRADPQSSRAHAGLGVAALKTGRPDEAIEHWRRAAGFDRTNYDALFNLGTELVNAGRLEEARPYLEQFVRTAPPRAYARDIERIRRLLAQ
ncbi:MAG TPA: sulfatase-like hydrolase/transferase [Vicinamibacterales bacterium]|nr:sulfatase-like hydrolase/transferase [Vicinamibacterales bacterium]